MVVLFPTCLGDAVAPSAVRDAAAVLRAAGVEPVAPRGAACCGQPAWNSGFVADARRVARTTLRALADADAVVVPAGSCAAMMRLHWPALFEGAERKLARTVASRVFELSQYLVDELGITSIGSPGDLTVAYHDSCHMLRELRIHDQPRTLLRSVATLVGAAPVGALLRIRRHLQRALPGGLDGDGRRQAGRRRGAGIELIASADRGCAMQLGGRASRTGRAAGSRASGNRAGEGAVSNFTTRSHERLGDPARRRALADDDRPPVGCAACA